MMPRRSLFTLAAAAAAVSCGASAGGGASAAGGPSASGGASAVGGDDVFHVAIFRFAKEHVDDALTAFRALAAATRQEPGSLAYDIYRGIDDDQQLYVTEHWASPAALAEHGRTSAFIQLGQGVLVKHATLHDTVTARPFDVAAQSSRASAVGGDAVFHVAVFRFAKEHIDDDVAAFRAVAAASRQESGNLAYEIYRGINDDQEFYVLEHWASPAALAEHGRTAAFIRLGQGVLVKHATLHDTVTARAFDVR